MAAAAVVAPVTIAVVVASPVVAAVAIRTASAVVVTFVIAVVVHAVIGIFSVIITGAFAFSVFAGRFLRKHLGFLGRRQAACVASRRPDASVSRRDAADRAAVVTGAHRDVIGCTGFEPGNIDVDGRTIANLQQFGAAIGILVFGVFSWRKIDAAMAHVDPAVFILPTKRTLSEKYSRDKSQEAQRYRPCGSFSHRTLLTLLEATVRRRVRPRTPQLSCHFRS